MIVNKVILFVGLLLSSCSVSYADPIYSDQMGGATAYSDGTSSDKMGGATVYSDGTSSDQMGDAIVYSDGTTSDRMGGATIYSGGASEPRTGNSRAYTSGSSSSYAGDQDPTELPAEYESSIQDPAIDQEHQINQSANTSSVNANNQDDDNVSDEKYPTIAMKKEMYFYRSKNINFVKTAKVSVTKLFESHPLYKEYDDYIKNGQYNSKLRDEINLNIQNAVAKYAENNQIRSVYWIEQCGDTCADNEDITDKILSILNSENQLQTSPASK